MTMKKRILRNVIIGLFSVSSLVAFSATYMPNEIHAQTAQSDVTLKHNSGVVTLTKPIRAYDSQNGNKLVTIPKGQTIHYQKEPEGVDVWNNKYPRNQNHHYVTVSTDESSLKSQANHDKNNNKPKGTSNIAARNKKAMLAKHQAALRAQAARHKKASAESQHQNQKGHLPKTSDSRLSPAVYYAVIICAVIFGTALVL